MKCPRCAGCTCPEWLEDVWALRCLNCGWRGGDALLEHHHALPVPPPPHTVILPVYDPEHRRLPVRLEV